jgi:hypothetical protein
MPLTHNVVIDQLLIPALFIFLLFAGVVGALLGVGLIVFRARIFLMLGAMNRWVSARKALAPLDTVHNVDPTVYKYRYWFSGLFIVGAAFSMIMIVAKLDVATVVALLGAGRLKSIAPWLVASLGWMLLVGSALAIVIGIILGFFPRALRSVETLANRWVSSRRIGKGVDDMYLMLDRWVANSPRIAGWIILIAALILAVNSTAVLLGRN